MNGGCIYVIYGTVLTGIQLLGSAILAKNEVTEKYPFLVPSEEIDMADLFRTENREYIFVNHYVPYYRSSTLCNIHYNGHLVIVSTLDLANFLAEALSETKLATDALWTAGRTNDSVKWFWYVNDTASQEPIDDSIVKLFVNYTLESNSQNCLAIGRKDHDLPHFPKLPCSVRRPFMCERERSSPYDGSTHPGWIPIGANDYKIFEEAVTWPEAEVKCDIVHKESHLAVVPDYKSVKKLGELLLIGRPSFENAWIGAAYYKSRYVFAQEDLQLANNTNPAARYPPWRYGSIQKLNGCVLLDRHVAVMYFVEERCKRLMPYICYKKRVKPFIDIFIDDQGYRIFPGMSTWKNAKKRCDKYKKKYQGKLPEIRDKKITSHLLFAMGESKTAIKHLWLGGRFKRNAGVWIWDSDRKQIDITILDWLQNSSYSGLVEDVNICLNMDREDHLMPLHYGTNCQYPQRYLCMFPRKKLEELQAQERETGVDIIRAANSISEK